MEADNEAEYTPPHDIRAEMELLSGILTYPEKFADVRSLVSAGDFYRLQHRAIWQCFDDYLELCDGKIPVDSCYTMIRMLLEDMKDVGKFALDYLPELWDPSLTIGPGLIPYKAARVRERAVLRDTVQATRDLRQSALNFDAPESLLSDFRDKVENLTSRLPGAIFEQIEIISERVIEAIQVRCQSQEEIHGVPTGLRDLDDIFAGFRPGQLIVLGGRPAMGKTQLGINLLHQAFFRGYYDSKQTKPSTVFVSLEMPKDEIAERLLSQLSGIPSGMLLRGTMAPGDVEKLRDGAERLKLIGLTLWDETDGVSTVQKIETRVRALPVLPDMIVIDYLQFMRCDKEIDNPNLMFETIMRDLKRLAVRLGIPIVVLSQLSRNLEARQNKRPQLSDLRDSGGIEQSADIVMFVYREVVYRPSVHPENIAEIIISKHRSGPLGICYATFEAATGVFSDNENGKYWKPEYKADEDDDTPKTRYSSKGGTHASNAHKDS